MSKWCIVGLVTDYWNQHPTSIQAKVLSEKVTFGPLPEVVSETHFDQIARLVPNIRTIPINLAFFKTYEGQSFSEYTGTGISGDERKGLNSLSLANLAVWIAKPSSVGIEILLHINVDDPYKRSFCYTVNRIHPHQKYKNTQLIQEDLEEASSIYKGLLMLKEDTSIEMATRFLGIALTEKRWETRYILLWIALESIFGPTDGREIRFRLSQRMAIFLAESRDELPALFTTAKKGYDQRSRLVHGNKLVELSDEEANKYGYEAEELTRKSLVKILKNEELISKFQGKDEFRENYLDGLVFDKIKF